jgi:hypothetical protein
LCTAQHVVLFRVCDMKQGVGKLCTAQHVVLFRVCDMKQGPY